MKNLKKVRKKLLTLLSGFDNIVKLSHSGSRNTESKTFEKT